MIVENLVKAFHAILIQAESPFIRYLLKFEYLFRYVIDNFLKLFRFYTFFFNSSMPREWESHIDRLERRILPQARLP